MKLFYVYDVKIFTTCCKLYLRQNIYKKKKKKKIFQNPEISNQSNVAVASKKHNNFNKPF